MSTSTSLVVGSGPAGAAAALFLATYGTATLVVTKYSRLSEAPRAHITNQRTMEAMRDMGVEETLMALATPWESMGNTTFCTSRAGEELGRIPSWGPTRSGTPTTSCRAPAPCSTHRRPSPSRC